MMAQSVPHQTTDRRRVKVYELRDNDWFDRGTGFCTAAWTEIDEGRGKEPRVIVDSEDEPLRTLLETRILDDNLSDDLAIEVPPSIQLPPAELGSLPDIETTIRVISSSANGRDTLAKLIMHEDYIGKLIPLVEMAEDLESLQDLHRLCNIMKTVLLLNDTTIIEHAVSDDCILGVVGALEYDPDFPQHKANHRQWLKDQSRYKEVVRIEDDQVRRRIHQTYRLQYMKDVVLARILDDPTFSVLNSMIFFNQVEIVQHLQSNGAFLRDLFSIFNPEEKTEQLRKKQAVLFIQQCCAIAKNLQIQNRQGFYSSLLNHGLLAVINFGLRNFDVSVRVGATDILVSMIDHDPHMIRHTLLRQILAKQLPLTDTLIDLLLVEVDLGVKSQISDALKVLLDTIPTSQGQDGGIKLVNGELQSRPRPMNQINSLEGQQQTILEDFYGRSAARLFKPLLDLEGRTELEFSVHNDGIFSYLNDILCFFARQHHNLCKKFIRDHNIASRFAQLLSCKEKHMQLVAIRFFRHLVNHLPDEFYVRLVAEKQVLGPILDVLLLTLPRDNLLSSACLDIFEYIRKENIKDLVKHLVENYREKMTALGYIETFRDLVRGYEQNRGFAGNMDTYFMESEDEMGRRPTHVNGRMMEQISVDPMEEEYWNTSDDEDENQTKLAARGSLVTGPSPSPGPLSALVDYHSDEESDENGGDVVMNQADTDLTKETKGEKTEGEPLTPNSVETASPSLNSTPPERLSEKRRREEEDDDELGKMMQQNKRRNSTSAVQNASGAAATLRKKKPFGGSPNSGTTGVKKIDIRLSPAIQSSVGQGSPGQDNAS
ncbi:Platinum sensitivity protein [Diaporthe australafricana]|uniref:Platinum sensitivity protein n=1 Tax=Diaporthe australafricana TaxID=127596 RepID=A0ABR3XFX4_9PEZI